VRKDDPVTGGERKKQASIDDISESTRWQVLTRIFSLLPVLYDIRFRESVGPQFDTLEQECWIEISRELCLLAESYRMSVDTATDLARSVSVLFMVVFGPDLRFQITDLSGDTAILTTRRCPYFTRTMELGITGPPLFGRCLSLTVPVVTGLNPRFTARYVRAMCMGDRGCEIKILRRELAEKEEGVQPENERGPESREL
jgi:hypothetical protein